MSRSRLRERHPKVTALGVVGLRLDAASLRADRAARDRQTQARAWFAGVAAAKRLEDRRQLLRREPRTGVSHVKGDFVAAILDGDLHRPRIGELDGVVGEILQGG